MMMVMKLLQSQIFVIACEGRVLWNSYNIFAWHFLYIIQTSSNTIPPLSLLNILSHSPCHYLIFFLCFCLTFFILISGLSQHICSIFLSPSHSSVSSRLLNYTIIWLCIFFFRFRWISPFFVDLGSDFVPISSGDLN